jgi:hypothetical protein
VVAQRQPTPEELKAYMRLTQVEITRLVLCLLIEDSLERHLAAFRSQSQNLLPQPVEGSKEFCV